MSPTGVQHKNIYFSSILKKKKSLLRPARLKKHPECQNVHSKIFRKVANKTEKTYNYLRSLMPLDQ